MAARFPRQSLMSDKPATNPAASVGVSRALITCGLGAVAISALVIFFPWSNIWPYIGGPASRVVGFLGGFFGLIGNVLVLAPKVTWLVCLSGALGAICFAIKTRSIKTRVDGYLGPVFVLSVIVAFTTLALLKQGGQISRYYQGEVSTTLTAMTVEQVAQLRENMRRRRSSIQEDLEEALPVSATQNLSDGEKRWIALGSRHWMRRSVKKFMVESECEKVKNAFVTGSIESQAKFPMTINGRPPSEARCGWLRFNEIEIKLPFAQPENR